MKIYKLSVLFLLTVLCLIFLVSPSSLSKSPGVEKKHGLKYEIRPQINLPEYGLLPSGITLTEGNVLRIEAQLWDIIESLQTIDEKLVQISERLERIEKTLNIKHACDSGGDSLQGDPNQQRLNR